MINWSSPKAVWNYFLRPIAASLPGRNYKLSRRFALRLGRLDAVTHAGDGKKKRRDPFPEYSVLVGTFGPDSIEVPV